MIQSHGSVEREARYLLNDVFTMSVAAEPFAAVADWRTTYNADPLGTFTHGVVWLESFYQQIHKAGDSLTALLGKRWLDKVRDSPTYRWCSGAARSRAPKKLDPLARELAWLDRIRLVRNAAVQHRVDRGLDLVGYAVIPECFGAVHRRRNDPPSMRQVNQLLVAAYRFGSTIQPGKSPEDAVFLSAIAEQLHDVQPELADEMRRAVIRSRAIVLFASAAFVNHLDVALARLLEARWPPAVAS